MASRDNKKEKSTTPEKNEKSNLLMLNENIFTELIKKQIIFPPYKYHENTPFSKYMDFYPLFFSKIECFEESEKTAYLLSFLEKSVIDYLKLLNPDRVLANCKYSDLVEELIKYTTKPIKYGSEYSDLLFVKNHYHFSIFDLHRKKIAQWTTFEQKASQKIPDLVKILIFFKEYREPLKTDAEKYIQENHSNINFDDFIQYMENESLFLKELF